MSTGVNFRQIMFETNVEMVITLSIFPPLSNNISTFSVISPLTIKGKMVLLHVMNKSTVPSTEELQQYFGS
jgi:hypothetical protein